MRPWPCAHFLPNQVIDVTTSKTGKHGHAKCHFTATDIFTGKKVEELVPSSHNLEVTSNYLAVLSRKTAVFHCSCVLVETLREKCAGVARGLLMNIDPCPNQSHRFPS